MLTRSCIKKRIKRNERINVAVQFSLGLTLRGLNHQTVGNRPRHGGAVETVVLQTLGNVDTANVYVVEGASVDDEFVSNMAVSSPEKISYTRAKNI